MRLVGRQAFKIASKLAKFRETLIQLLVSRFRHMNIVACLLKKKRLAKVGGSRASQDDPLISNAIGWEAVTKDSVPTSFPGSSPAVRQEVEETLGTRLIRSVQLVAATERMTL